MHFKRTIALALASLSVIVAFSAPMKPAEVLRATSAVQRSLPLLQRSSRSWFKGAKCTSCHHHSLAQVVVGLAEERGIAVNKGISRLVNQTIVERRSLDRFEQLEGTGAINGSAGYSYMLFGMAAAKEPISDLTDSSVYYLLSKQNKRGFWPSLSHRTPLEDSPVTLTALALRGISLYAPDYLKKESELAIGRARKWLLSVKPKSNEEATFKLLGLKWAGASSVQLLPSVRTLNDRQNADGGWSQIPTRTSDSYATGQALVALHLAGGVPTSDLVFKKGIQNLLKTQEPDGSWLVETRRRFPGLPYFETGFPHKQHQFISFCGTSWATMALTLSSTSGPSTALLATSVGGRRGLAQPLATSPKDNRLLWGALRGSMAELKSAIAAGASVNARSIGGATPLMYAVRNPKLVAFLLSNGADPNLVSKADSSALMVAAGFPGATESVRLLLKAGAKPVGARFMGENALSLAAASGDLERMKLLLDSGAKLSDLGVVAGVVALSAQEPAMLRHLVARGLDVDKPVDENGSTMLTYAVQDGSEEVISALLEMGANPNVVTKEGFTPVMYAAVMDHGHDRIVKMLLAAGADASYKTPEGKSAMSLAVKYRAPHLARAISGQ